MQIKKSRRVELERKKPTLFFLGLALACAAVLSAFEWKTPIEQSRIGCTLSDEVPVMEAAMVPLSVRKREKLVEKKRDVKKDVAKTIIDEFRYDDINPLKADVKFPELEEEPIVEDIAQLKEEVFEEKILPIADVMPEFPGGDSARVVFLQNQVIYPPMAKHAGISGKVYVGFTVRKDGSITDIEVKRRVGGGLDEEAVKAVKAMPKWNPGFNNGRPVNVSFVMPVTFTLK